MGTLHESIDPFTVALNGLQRAPHNIAGVATKEIAELLNEDTRQLLATHGEITQNGGSLEILHRGAEFSFVVRPSIPQVTISFIPAFHLLSFGFNGESEIHCDYAISHKEEDFLRLKGIKLKLNKDVWDIEIFDNQCINQELTIYDYMGRKLHATIDTRSPEKVLIYFSNFELPQTNSCQSIVTCGKDAIVRMLTVPHEITCNSLFDVHDEVMSRISSLFKDLKLQQWSLS